MKILGSAYIPETDFAFQLSTTRRSTNICFRSQMIIASYFRSSFGRLRTNSCSKYSFPWTTSESRRSEEHTSELQSLMRISYAVFCLKKKKKTQKTKQIIA